VSQGGYFYCERLRRFKLYLTKGYRGEEVADSTALRVIPFVEKRNGQARGSHALGGLPVSPFLRSGNIPLFGSSLSRNGSSTFQRNRSNPPPHKRCVQAIRTNSLSQKRAEDGCESERVGWVSSGKDPKVRMKENPRI